MAGRRVVGWVWASSSSQVCVCVVPLLFRRVACRQVAWWGCCPRRCVRPGRKKRDLKE